jgi:hypothetical protein
MISIKSKAETADRKLQDLAQHIRKEHPRATKQQFLELWKAAIEADADLKEALLDWTFNDYVERLKREEPDLVWVRPDTEH